MSSVLLVLLVAAASSTRPALEAMKPELERIAAETVEIQYGSTGTLARQIENGAPFDLFLSADEETPSRLVRTGHLLKSIPCYAVGVLVLLRSRDAGFALPARVDRSSAKVLAALPFRHLAVASSKSAPYGRAASEVMGRLDIAGAVAERVVTGENVEQALSYVRSGNAELGFVSAAQAIDSGLTFAPVDDSLHRPLRQHAGIVSASKRKESAGRVLQHLLSPQARSIWDRYGYRAP